MAKMRFEMPDDYLPWEQQPGESSRSFHAFCHYRDMGHERSIDKAYRQHKKQCESIIIDRTKRASGPWHDWNAKFGWRDRAALYDKHVDAENRKAFAKQQKDARERHARTANGAITALTIPVRATLEALQDPKTMATMIEAAKESPRTLMKLIDMVSWCARSMPGLVDVERLALGMTTDFVEVVKTDRDTDFGYSIPSDPVSAELAIQLLNRFAAAREGATERPGVFGPAGDRGGAMAPGSASGPTDEEAD